MPRLDAALLDGQTYIAAILDAYAEVRGDITALRLERGTTIVLAGVNDPGDLLTAIEIV